MRTLIVAQVLLLAGGVAMAQTSQPPTSAPTAPPPAMATPPVTATTPTAPARPMTTEAKPAAPLPGSNSFTEAQARSRIERDGVSNVSGLKKDEHGIWRGQAMRGTASVKVALDYKGNVFVQ